MLKDRNSILRPYTTRYAEIYIPLLGDTIRVCSVPELERSRIEARQAMARSDDEREQNVRELRARWIVRCVVDENGQRLFTTKDIAEWMAADAGITGPLYQGIVDHCIPVGQSVEDHEKNSEATRGDCSPQG